MNLVVFSHKLLWRSSASPSGFATDGGFAIQMQAISELFDNTTIVTSVAKAPHTQGEVFIKGHNIKVYPLDTLRGSDLSRKLSFMPWFVKNYFIIRRLIKEADGVHTPIPGDIGTIGMIMAYKMKKPLFVRYCGDWFTQNTRTKRFIKGFMEAHGGGRNVMLATGGAAEPPSKTNAAIKWIFSTSLKDSEIRALRQRTHHFDRGQPRFIIAATRQEKEKGTDKALKALGLLKNKYPGFSFDVLGTGSYLPVLKVLAKELGIEANVNFHGKVSHDMVVRLMQSADILLYPTASEGFPKVVFEAMACGLPVITNPVSVLPQLIAQGGGVLLENDGPQYIADAISLIVDNTSTYDKMQECAFKTAGSLSLESWRDTIGGYLEEAWGKLRND